MNQHFQRLQTQLTVALSVSLIVILGAWIIVSAEEPANEEFQRTWERTDLPIVEGEVSRTWIWGPEGITDGITEEYAEAEGGERTVQYFDKSRMEIPVDTEANVEGSWEVTNGLLPIEMMTGELQVGDDEFVTYDPAEINIAGDPSEDENTPDAPTYAEVAPLMDGDPIDVGETITATMDASGEPGTDDAFAEYGITGGEYVEDTDHTVASVFWDFMNSEGPIYEDGQHTTGLLFDNPFFAFGFPVTEAYWTEVSVGGELNDVLVQVFERRVATYTPGNPEGWEVEFGNVGQHYLQWRYEILPGTVGDAPAEPTATPEPTEAAPTETPADDDRGCLQACGLEYGLGDLGDPGAPIGEGEFSEYTEPYTELPRSDHDIGEVHLGQSPFATINQQKTLQAVVLSTSQRESPADQVYYVIDWNDGSATITDTLDPHEGQFFPHTFYVRGDFEVKVWAVDPEQGIRTNVETVTFTVE